MQKIHFSYISRITLVLLLAVIGFNANAASNRYLKGSIYTLTGDTVKGFIMYQTYNQCYRSCVFHTAESGKDSEKKYFPGDISGFSFSSGRNYVKTVLPGTDTLVFMECMYNGKLEVYQWEDSLQNKRFYIKKDTLPMKELKYTNELGNYGNTEGVKTWNNYPYTLYFYLNDAREPIKKAYDMKEPNEEDLIQIATDYNLSMTKKRVLPLNRRKYDKQFLVELSVLFYDYLSLGNRFNDVVSVFDNSCYQWLCLSEIPSIFSGLYWYTGYNTKIGIPVGADIRPKWKFVQPSAGASLNYLPGFMGDSFGSLGLNAGLNLVLTKNFSVGFKKILYHPFVEGGSDFKCTQLSVSIAFH